MYTRVKKIVPIEKNNEYAYICDEFGGNCLSEKQLIEQQMAQRVRVCDESGRNCWSQTQLFIDNPQHLEEQQCPIGVEEGPQTWEQYAKLNPQETWEEQQCPIGVEEGPQTWEQYAKLNPQETWEEQQCPIEGEEEHQGQEIDCHYNPYNPFYWWIEGAKSLINGAGYNSETAIIVSALCFVIYIR
jgi:hypothetical protein